LKDWQVPFRRVAAIPLQYTLVTTTVGAFAGEIGFQNNDLDENPFNFAVIGRVLAPMRVTAALLEFEIRQALSLTFNRPLDPATVSASDLLAQNLTTVSAIPASDVVLSSGNTVATWLFIGASHALVDGAYRFELPADSVADDLGNVLDDTYIEQGSAVFVFAADANRDRFVNIQDFSVLAANFNKSGTFSQGDFNYSGTIDIQDFSILASKFNTSLPVPSAAEGPAPAWSLRPSSTASRPVIAAAAAPRAVFGRERVRWDEVEDVLPV
jgi:hypothetical protein